MQPPVAVQDAGTYQNLLCFRLPTPSLHATLHCARRAIGDPPPTSGASSPVVITIRSTANIPQAYNSVFNQDPNPPRLIGNFPLLPLRTKTRGPAYVLPAPATPLPASESPDPDSESYDILDEVLALFRANTFFRNFEIQGPADRLLVYGIWFLSDCLHKIRPTAGVRDAQKDVMNLALDLNFAIPGDPGFPLNQVSLLSVQMITCPCPAGLIWTDCRCTSRPGIDWTPSS